MTSVVQLEYVTPLARNRMTPVVQLECMVPLARNQMTLVVQLEYVQNRGGGREILRE